MILALDQGTTSSRAIVFDSQLQTRGVAQQEFTQYFPQSGWVEHDAREIWQTQFAVAHQALDAAGVSPEDLSGIGITNQRETVVIWNRETGEPIHNAIVWQDRRTSDLCKTLRQSGQEEIFRDRTGLVLDPYFSATKIQWLLSHVPGAQEAAEAGVLAMGTMDSWLIWNLTSGQSHVTDHSNASRTLLYNLHTQTWDDELLSIFGIPREMLPEIVDSSGVCTSTTQFGNVEIPIAGIAGDQQAALFGQTCFEPGMGKSTDGTGCFILLNIGDRPLPSPSRLLTTVAWSMNGSTEYALEGSVFMGGATVQWLRDGLGIIQSASEIEDLAKEVPDTGGIVLVPAFAGLGAPYWDAEARGSIQGMTRGTNRAHIARAALESIALQVQDVVEAMMEDGCLELQEIRVDGGASVNTLLMQLQSDLLNVPLTRPQNHESTALGAACLAGLATGVWPDQATLASKWKVEAQFTPQMPDAERASFRQRWLMAVERSKEWQTL